MKSDALNGLDSLLATVQMPSGVPVATVAVNGAANAVANVSKLGNGADLTGSASGSGSANAKANKKGAKAEKAPKADKADKGEAAAGARKGRKKKAAAAAG